MAERLQGEDKSLWVGTTEQTDYPTLKGDKTVYDVVIVGGGITGIAAAYALQREGKSVALVERGRIVEWTTGGTTAKLSSQHYLVYDYLINRHGEEAAAAFARANQHGIDEVERLGNELGIDCDFSRRDAYAYTQDEGKIGAMKQEVAAALKLGLPASFETAIGLPYDVKGAVKFANQAQFHPRKFLLGIAEHFVAAGGMIYEQTEATDIVPGNPNTVVTKRGNVQGRAIFQASGEPFWGGDILEGRMWIKMSYALAVTLKDASAYPTGMYITTDHPMRTIRTADYDGGQALIFGGESHEYDEGSYDPDAHYQNLIEDVTKRFAVDKILYRWLAGDFMPYDRMPYIGPLPDHPSIYIATGYRAWGLAWAMSAAEIICGCVSGKPHQWAKPFSLDRLASPPRTDDFATG